MKKFLTLIIVIMISAISLFVFSACQPVERAGNTQTENDSFRTVYATYVAFAEENGTTPLSYEEWLESVKGKDGKDGASVTKAAINEDGYLVFTLSDGNELIAGKVKGKDGKDGSDGTDGTDGVSVTDASVDENGDLIITLSDGNVLNAGKVKGTDGINGTNGADGVYVTDSAIDENGDLIITLSNGQTLNAGKVKETDDGTNGFTFYPLPDGTYAVSAGTTKYLDTITIPSTHNGKPVTAIAPEAFKDANNLISITIPDSVTNIGKYAFSGCSSLTSITIPDGVTSIAYETFSVCSKLKSINIPDSVTNISYDAFELCSLSKVYYSGTVSQWAQIGGLYNLPISNGSIYFNNVPLNEMTEIVLENVTEIKPYAFRNCSSLTSVTIGNGVTSIGSNAFWGCRSLTSVTIHDSVTSIGSDAFRDCENLTSIYYNGTVSQWVQISGLDYLVGSNRTIYIDNLPLNEMTEIVLENVAEIKSSAFYGCSSLTSVTIPDGVTSIGSYAFRDCSGLTNVIIGNGVTSIGYYAFYGCSKLGGIIFRGTKDQWYEINFGSNWDMSLPSDYKVYCDDGTIEHKTITF